MSSSGTHSHNGPTPTTPGCIAPRRSTTTSYWRARLGWNSTRVPTCTLLPGDVVVQNGIRHRWHNRGTTIARVLAFSAGAVHQIAGGGPVST